MASKPETTVETVETKVSETSVDALVSDAAAETSSPDVISFGGKWIASIGGEVVTFPSESEAQTAVALDKNKVAIEAEAEAYCAARGFEGKNKVGKMNLVFDFLAWKTTK